MHKCAVHRARSGDFYDEMPWTYSDVYQRQQTQGPERIVAAPWEDQVGATGCLFRGFAAWRLSSWRCRRKPRAAKP